MESGYSGSERRKSERVRVNITVAYQIEKPISIKMLVGEEEVEATIVDISEGGLAILTKHDLPIDTLLLVEFMLIRIDKETNFKYYESIKIKGEVKSSVLLAEDKYRLGVSFKNLEEESKFKIAAFVRKGGPTKEPDIYYEGLS